MSEILNSREVLEGLTRILRNLDSSSPDYARAKVYSCAIGKVLSAIKVEADITDSVKRGTLFSKRITDYLEADHQPKPIKPHPSHPRN